MSVAGKYISETVNRSYKDGKHRSDKMRSALISDGSKIMELTVWSDIIYLIKSDTMLQLVNLSSRSYSQQLVLSTNFGTSLCYLTSNSDYSVHQLYRIFFPFFFNHNGTFYFVQFVILISFLFKFKHN